MLSIRRGGHFCMSKQLHGRRRAVEVVARRAPVDGRAIRHNAKMLIPEPGEFKSTLHPR